LLPVTRDGLLELYLASAVAQPVQIRIPLSGEYIGFPVEVMHAIAYGETGHALELAIVGGPATSTPTLVGPQLALKVVPNPFNPATEFQFELREQAVVRAVLFDSTGREVRRFDRFEVGPGEHRLRWDGTDSRGKTVASGAYWVLLQAGDLTATRAITLLK
jgi:hypothetical protein